MGNGTGTRDHPAILQHLGGDIQVKSEAGQGTTFTMRLPEQLQAPESERAGSPESSSTTVQRETRGAAVGIGSSTIGD